jgi:hypothetical protein
MSAHRRSHRPDRHNRRAFTVRRLAHMYGELVATADSWPLEARERRLLEEAARGLRTALRTSHDA